MPESRRYLRFPLADRIEHWVQVLSFTTLAVTGLVQKFPTAGVSAWVVHLLRGIETTRLIHRTAAIVFTLEAVYHLGSAGYRLLVRRVRPSMLPGVGDVGTALKTLLYNVGLKRVRPPQGRYTFEEKMEYWAVIWGTVIMAVTGFIMWNPLATTRLLPGVIVPAAKAAHGGEAILAVLAILVWHFYTVHLKRFNKSMFTGYLSEAEMEDEHPLELAERKAGTAPPAPDPRAFRRRKRIYLSAYAVLAAILIAGVYFLATFEQTAASPAPMREAATVVAPLTPTLVPRPIVVPGTPAAALTSWENGIGALLHSRCGECHAGSNPVSGLDLTTYQGALRGGQGGPAVIPGDPDGSLLVIMQSPGNHAGQISPSELEGIRQWIAAGAPER
jgi:formate dehydrogenase gamma subunit